MIMINRSSEGVTDGLNWLTIQEAADLSTQSKAKKLTCADIYRHALHGDINLSVYFQSPVTLRRICTSQNKVKLREINSSPINRLCFLEKNSFLNNRNLIVSTERCEIHPAQQIIDTTLPGHEYVLVQRLLAQCLGIPLPITANVINYGLSVSLHGELFQIFEDCTWQKRIQKQIMRLPRDIAMQIAEQVSAVYGGISRFPQRGIFPVYDLPKDACFVIRHSELEKLMSPPVKNDTHPPSSTRISTPISRFFWLACKHNNVISPLISQPYKLLSIFEQWAKSDGITDRLSGDTLKAALERGSPTPVSAEK